MKIELTPIGFIKTETENIPRHWTISDAKGSIVMDEQYKEGLKDIKAGQRIVVLFYFHQSPRFTPDLLVQKPRHRNMQLGVFSFCSRSGPILSACLLWRYWGLTATSSMSKGWTCGTVRLSWILSR